MNAFGIHKLARTYKNPSILHRLRWASLSTVSGGWEEDGASRLLQACRSKAKARSRHSERCWNVDSATGGCWSESADGPTGRLPG